MNEHLDHATMLGVRDRLIAPLVAEGNRVFRFGAEQPADHAEEFGYGLPWPTVEAVAVLLGRVAESTLIGLARADGARVERVLVRETQLNTAVYEPRLCDEHHHVGLFEASPRLSSCPSIVRAP
ncbi:MULTISPECIES: hypothetical protein [Nocardia]|uniref:hypothetical protein n=1 Tax=Nocardia TaxID=1817 RepID=UPI000BF1BFEE|nr:MULTISPECIES: hypothetical protein [Nocardia]MBF6188747.1 hypothetical protein [Nocardia farcinica]MBF6295589.1 hypothetical protein [Nocardia farcinica]MBF6313331.1 hypothetical protein [Nocardia farcinica]MBF6375452.1 hypothetical protein [Nocardia farcinica]MBF6382209.1 hypothetical protein [Nocardia farcinica]